MSRTNFPYGERFTVKYLYDKFGWINHKDYIHPYVSKYKSWLHGLHLDFYFPKLHKAVEIQGGQHIQCTNWDGKKPYIDQQLDLASQLIRDIVKESLCIKYNIKLIPIDTNFKRKSTINRHIEYNINKYFDKSNSNYSERSEKQLPNIRGISYSLPLISQKILSYLICTAKYSNRSKQMIAKFNTHKYIKLFHFKKSGTTFKVIMNAVKHIASYHFYVKHSKNSYDLWHWFDKVHVKYNNYQNGDFIITFSKEFEPYLKEFNDYYRDIYNFSDIMRMKSKYSPYLYRMFLSNQIMSRNRVQNYSIKNLRHQLHLGPKYSSYSEFRRNVLSPVKNDINKYSDYKLGMRAIHAHSRGRKVEGIRILMKSKMNTSKIA